MSIRLLNPNAEVLNKSGALHMNINAAKGLQDVLKTNLGPKGTIKMYVFLLQIFFFFFGFVLDINTTVIIVLLMLDFRLVGGAGDIKLTKDGNTLLKEMVCSKTLTSSNLDLFLLSRFLRRDRENDWICELEGDALPQIQQWVGTDHFEQLGFALLG